MLINISTSKSSLSIYRYSNGNVRDVFHELKNLEGDFICFGRTWDENQQLVLEEHYLNDDFYNLNGPAFRSWSSNSTLLEEIYSPKINDITIPSYQSWDDKGQLIKQKFYGFDGDDEILICKIWRNGVVLREVHYLNKRYHNENCQIC